MLRHSDSNLNAIYVASGHTERSGLMRLASRSNQDEIGDMVWWRMVSVSYHASAIDTPLLFTPEKLCSGPGNKVVW